MVITNSRNYGSGETVGRVDEGEGGREEGLRQRRPPYILPFDSRGESEVMGRGKNTVEGADTISSS